MHESGGVGGGGGGGGEGMIRVSWNYVRFEIHRCLYIVSTQCPNAAVAPPEFLHIWNAHEVLQGLAPAWPMTEIIIYIQRAVNLRKRLLLLLLLLLLHAT